MKSKLLLLAIAATLSIPGLAQENETIKEETTVKRVVKKEGSKVITTEVSDVTKEKGKVLIDGNSDLNQNAVESSTMDKDKKILQDDVEIDEKNESLKEEIKEQHHEEIQSSIDAQRARIEEQKKLLEEQKLERQRLLEENRKKLEKRPKGMAKLKKDN